MKDILFVTLCKHRIRNYRLKIEQSNNEYFAKFPCNPIQAPNQIYIRSWEEEQKYLRTLKDYKEAQSYAFNIASGSKAWDAPPQGANAKIGIGGYAFVTNDTIKFNALPGTYRTIDPNPNLVPQNIYLVDFTAELKSCPLCRGTNCIVDVAIDSEGKAVYVEGGDKIKQRVVKALMQPVGSCISDPTFGSELNNMVGTMITTETRILLQTTIVNAMNNLIANQPATYTPYETINTLEGITIEAVDDQQDAFFVKVIVSSEAGETIDCSVGFKLK